MKLKEAVNSETWILYIVNITAQKTSTSMHNFFQEESMSSYFMSIDIIVFTHHIMSNIVPSLLTLPVCEWGCRRHPTTLSAYLWSRDEGGEEGGSEAHRAAVVAAGLTHCLSLLSPGADSGYRTPRHLQKPRQNENSQDRLSFTILKGIENI